MRLWPTRLAALVGVALVLAPAAAATADTADPTDTAPTDAELLLVLDASSSMAEPDADGAPRIDAARTALHAMIEELAPEQAVGLRVFGGAVHEDRPDAQTCVDSELVVPVGTGNADALSQAVEAYAPLGDTPIAYALQQAAGDLSETGERTIVLVSDGVETCDPDPCEVARELRAGGLDLVIHTVGLGADDRTRSQLQCIAAAGGGEYFGASDAETLTTALGRLATRAFRPFVYSGTPVVGTPSPQGAPELAVGEYTDTIAETEGEPKHYTVLRSQPGSRLLVGVTMKNPSPSGVSAVDVRLRTTDDRLCGSATMPVTSIGGQSSFGSAGVATPVDGPAACTDDDGLVLSLGAGAGSQQILGETVQIVVEEIPPVVDADSLPGPAASPEWSGLTAGTPAGDVVGGVSPSVATPVEAGTTVAFDLVPGEIAFFSVPVDYGQGLEALVDFAGADGPLAEEMRPTSNALDVAIIAPHRAQVHDPLADAGGARPRAVLGSTEPAQAAAVMREVRWANDGDNDPVLAGEYVIMVSLTSTRERLVPLPLTLTTNVVGEVSGVPEHAAPEQVEEAPEATDSQASSAPAEQPSAADGPSDDEPAASWLVWLLAAAGVLVAGVGVVLLRRGRSVG